MYLFKGYLSVYPSCYSTVIYPSKCIFLWDTFWVLEPRYLLRKESFCKTFYKSHQAPYLNQLSFCSQLVHRSIVGWAGIISQISQYIYSQPLLGQHHLLSVVVSHTHLHFFLPRHVFKYPHHQAACGRWMHWDTEPCACSYSTQHQVQAVLEAAQPREHRATATLHLSSSPSAKIQK